MTFVLVITGKGRTVGPDSERGVLRRQVPEMAVRCRNSAAPRRRL